MPSAVRLTKGRPWHDFLCGDGHFLETLDDTEKEVFSNLMREQTPLLIALTGRAGVEPEGVEPLDPAVSRTVVSISRHTTWLRCLLSIWSVSLNAFGETPVFRV